MKYLILCMPLIFLFFNEVSLAQKKQLTIEWKIAGFLPAANGQPNALGIAGPVAGVNNDVLIVAGGSNFPDGMPWLGGKKKYYDDLYVFRKKDKDSLENYKSLKLPFSVAYAATCTTPKGIVFAGGENEKGLSNKVLMIKWNPTTQNIIIKNLPDLPFAITNASITSSEDKIYLAGGESANEVSNNFLTLDLGNVEAGWKILPSLSKPVSHAVMVVQSNGHYNCIYLMGGRRKNVNSTSDLYSSTLQFDPETNKWLEKKSLPYCLSASSGVATGSSYIILFGGDKGETFHKTERLLAAINKEKNEVKIQQLNQLKIDIQSSHPGFSKDVLLYNTVINEWQKCGYIFFNAPVTTTACKWGNDFIIPGGEIKAGVRTPQILLGKLSVN